MASAGAAIFVDTGCGSCHTSRRPQEDAIQGHPAIAALDAEIAPPSRDHRRPDRIVIELDAGGLCTSFREWWAARESGG